MGELITTDGNTSATNNNVSPRKPLREESNSEQQGPLNNLVAAAAAGLALRPPHSAYMNSIALHHGVCH